MALIVAFSGKRGTGKTAAAQYLANNYWFTKVSFADKLRDIAQGIFPFGNEHFAPLGKEVAYSDKDKTYGFTPREFMINLGACIRFHDPEYFIKNLDIWSQSMVAIDDLRLKNEAEYLHESEAIIIRMERSDKFNPYKTKLDIKTETDLDDYDKFDYTIPHWDNENLVVLYKALDIIMGDLELPRKVIGK